MKHRKLRIAWSVTWGVVAVLLCVLWAVSYWWAINYQLTGVAGRNYQAVLLPGVVRLHSASAKTPSGRVWSKGLSVFNYLDSGFADMVANDTQLRFKVNLNTNFSGDVTILFPYWSVALVPTILATIPWLRFRFSLRTLLIATTLVAMVLGIIVSLS